jgi:hypothetical protein
MKWPNFEVLVSTKQEIAAHFSLGLFSSRFGPYFSEDLFSHS